MTKRKEVSEYQDEEYSEDSHKKYKISTSVNANESDTINTANNNNVNIHPSVAINKKGKIPLLMLEPNNQHLKEKNKQDYLPKITHNNNQNGTQELPLADPENEIVYVTTNKTLGEVCARLKKDCEKDFILGLDCEWTPSWTKGQADNKRTAVIQLASEHLTAVFHIPAFLPVNVKTLPGPLAELLADNNILKVVLGGNDKVRIANDFGIDITNIDIQHLHERLRGVSLKSMAEEFMKKTVKKSNTLKSWERIPLPPPQLHYAALDAELTRKIYFLVKDNPSIPIFAKSNYGHKQQQMKAKVNKEIADKIK